MKQWKRFSALGMAALLLLCLAACGNVRGVNKKIVSNSLYTEAQIHAAMRVVMLQFEKDFDGCTLTDLWYDEDRVKEAQTDWAAQYDAEEAMVLLSNFHVGATGGDGSLNRNSDYTDWQWILVRSATGAWELKTWGYG